jgi:glycosyltransferase involved in cell wall biosynthesis
VGRGRQASALKRIAGPTIEFIGHADDKELIKLYRNCRALLFASNEDFGIVPVEAQSYGRPVIAFGHGGVKETVIDIESAQGEGTTGVFFAEQTSEALSEAILRFEAVESTFNPQEIQQHSFRYSVGRFEADFRALVDNVAHEAGFTP